MSARPRGSRRALVGAAALVVGLSACVPLPQPPAPCSSLWSACIEPAPPSVLPLESATITWNGGPPDGLDDPLIVTDTGDLAEIQALMLRTPTVPDNVECGVPDVTEIAWTDEGGASGVVTIEGCGATGRDAELLSLIDLLVQDAA